MEKDEKDVGRILTRILDLCCSFVCFKWNDFVFFLGWPGGRPGEETYDGWHAKSAKIANVRGEEIFACCWKGRHGKCAEVNLFPKIVKNHIQLHFLSV